VREGARGKRVAVTPQPRPRAYLTTIRGWQRVKPTLRPTNRGPDLGFRVGAGEGNRTLMTSLEGWGSAIELRPRCELAATVAYRVPGITGAGQGPAQA
jgi:hypothetical protein